MVKNEEFIDRNESGFISEVVDDDLPIGVMVLDVFVVDDDVKD